MVSATIEGFSVRESSDRNFFLLILAAIWAGVLAGFIPDSINHFREHHVAYAPIVHVHAVTYVAWLALLTIQMSLIRSGRADLHRRLGPIALVMVPWMAIIGPWTSLTMGHLQLGTADGNPPFLILPVLTAASFAVVTFAGLAMRANSPVHKRLMLIGAIILSVAGFSRWLGPELGPMMAATFGKGWVSFFIPHFVCGDLLLAAILIHDLTSRGRILPPVGLAAAFAVATQAVITAVYLTPAWTPISIGILRSWNG